MFNKILVAIDHSTMSRKVFKAGLSLAKATGASLMLLHVLSSSAKDYPAPFIYYGLEYNPSAAPILEVYQEQLQTWKQEGQKFLSKLAEEAKQAGVKTEFRQAWGEPESYICDLAAFWSAELIIVGSRGLTGVKEMFLGSVSNYVTHHAPCSVLIVRSDAHLNFQSSTSNFSSTLKPFPQSSTTVSSIIQRKEL
ncbi:MAG: universal stress protein [Xenococcaceae cyanobacterium]